MANSHSLGSGDEGAVAEVVEEEVEEEEEDARLALRRTLHHS